MVNRTENRECVNRAYRAAFTILLNIECNRDELGGMSKNGQQRGYTGTNRDIQGSTVIIRHKPSVIATTTGYSGKIRGFTGTPSADWCKLSLIALSHIHVSAAYRSRIYEIFDTTRSEPYFVRATYVARTSDVLTTFPRRISDVSVFL